MKRTRFISFVLCTIFFCGCRHLTMTSFKTGETVKLVTHSLSRKAWATMPDGEVLQGKFSTMPEEAVGVEFGSSTAFGGGTSASAFGSGTSVAMGSHGAFYILLKSTRPGSHLMMEVEGVYNPLNGSGFGNARTNDGRTYKIVF